MSNSSNNGKGKGKGNGNGNGKEREELVFELSPIQTYDVTFVEKTKGKSKVGELREKGKAKGKEKGRGKGRCLARVKGEYQFSTRTISVEMDDEDIKELAKDPNVVKIEPDILIEPSAVYSAPFHANTDWMLDKVGAKTAFANGISGQGVRVAVLDSGVDTDNPMLAHAIKGGTSVVDWSNDYEDITGHGTMVAGIVAGKHQGNAYGVAPDVDLYAVKITVSETNGSATLGAMAMGVEWAINNGMQAINLSFGANGSISTLDTAIARAHSLGVPVFNASGNSNEDIDATKAIHTRCKNDGVYCVLALKKEDTLADFSAFGDEGIAFSTYGADVAVVGVNNPNPTTSSGTSFASPLAMGIFALYKCKYPHLNGHEIIQLMKTNGRNLSLHNYLPIANFPVYVGDAVVNPPSTPTAPTLTLLSVSGDTAVVRATVPSTSAPFDKLIIDNRWTSNTSDRVITIKNKTRSYDLVIQAPAFNTQYQASTKAVNGNLESGWSSVLTFTTTSETSNMQPLRATVEYVDNDGLNVTYRAKVPASSPTFNKLNIDYFWTSDDVVLNMPHTRTHDFTVTLPSYNTSYSIDAKAINGTSGGLFSKACTMTIADENATTMPLKAKLSVVSINGKSVRFRAEVPKYSPMMDKLSVYQSWNGGLTSETITFPKTRVYEWTAEAPQYNTAYYTYAFPYNGSVSGYGTGNVEFTTGSATGNQPTPIAPLAPTISLVSVNGKNVTVRTTVPSNSIPFNKLSFDYYWVSGAPDNVVTMVGTRSYDTTFTAPDFNTTYTLDVMAFNGDASSAWSNALSFTTGADNAVVAPANPTLSLVSVNGKTVTLRASVPSTSAPFNKLSIDHRWVSGGYEIVTMPNTRSYDFTFTAPQFNTAYQTDVMAYNGEMSSGWSNVLSYTTGAEQVVAPANPTLSLISVNGKEVKVRATVPSTSAPFNKLQFDYYWISGTEDYVISMSNTRSYDMTFTAPNFNTQYKLDVKAFNGSMSSGFSPSLTFTTGSNGGGTGGGLVIEDFTDNSFNFNFAGTWYRDSTINALRSPVTSHNGLSTTAFNVDAGTNGASLSIEYKVSSEQGYDFLSIYIDGDLHVYESGVIDYKTLTTQLSSGVHLITLVYSKDGSASTGEDAGFIKRIAMYTY